MQNKRKFDFLLLAEILLSIVGLFSVYEIFVVGFGVLWMFWVYYGALILLPIAYVALNYGGSRYKVTREVLPAAWTEEEKDRYLDDTAKRKRQTRFLPVLFCGFAFAMLYDVCELFAPQYLSPIKELIAGWFN